MKQVLFESTLPTELIVVLKDIRGRLERAVGVDTVYPKLRDEWTPDNKMRGQCWSISTVIQKIFGGTIYRSHVLYKGKKETHYFNRIPWRGIHVFVDLTSDQYGGRLFNPAGMPEVAVEWKFLKQRQKTLINRYYSIEGLDRGKGH